MKRRKRFQLFPALFVLVFLSSCADNSTEEDDTSEETWQTVFTDNFNRAEGDPGSNWASQLWDVGSVEISDNKLQVSGGSAWAVRYAGIVDQSRIMISARCSTTTATPDYYFAVFARSQNLGNNWMEQEFYFAGATPSADSISVGGYSGNEFQDIISGDFDLVANKWYTISLECNGQSLTMIILDEAADHADTLSFTDTQAALTGTTVSLNGMQDENETIYFDDFTVQSFE